MASEFIYPDARLRLLSDRKAMTMSATGRDEMHARDADMAGHRPNDPRIWLIVSNKLGDNAQLRAIAEALPWSCEEKRVAVRDEYVLGKPRVAATIDHLDRAHSAPLEPPWPDLVITIGRRLSMVALWIQERSGGRTKLVLIGPPKRFLRRFDLVVISSQYRLPERPNVLRLEFPLQRVAAAAIAAASRSWAAEFAALQRPLIACMVGGRTKAVRIDAEVAATLAQDTARLAEREGGSLIVTTSRRTPNEVVDTLARDLPADAMLYQWNCTGGRNPYLALLGLADRFVVTGDSISMLVEIARLGRPLAIYRLPPGLWPAVDRLRRMLSRLLPKALAARLEATVRELAYRLGPLGHYRDLTAIQRLLVQKGAAVWFGERFAPEAKRLPDELPQVISRITALLGRA